MALYKYHSCLYIAIFFIYISVVIYIYIYTRFSLYIFSFLYIYIVFIIYIYHFLYIYKYTIFFIYICSFLYIYHVALTGFRSFVTIGDLEHNIYTKLIEYLYLILINASNKIVKLFQGIVDYLKHISSYSLNEY